MCCNLEDFLDTIVSQCVKDIIKKKKILIIPAVENVVTPR